MQSENPWFSHDAGARNSKKIRILRKKFGAQGYAWFFMMLEVFRDQNQLVYLVSSEDDWEYLADELDASIEETKFFVAECCRLGLFKMEKNQIWSESGKRRMAQRLKNIEVWRENGKKGGRPKNSNNQEVNQAVSEEEPRGFAVGNQNNQILTKPKPNPNHTKQDKTKQDEMNSLPPTPLSQPESGSEKKSGFSSALEALQQIRDKHEGKISNVNEFEKQQISKLCWHYGLEKVTEQIEKLGKLRKFGSIDQIERLLKGQPLPSKATDQQQTRGEIPEYKPKTQKKQAVPPPAEIVENSDRDDLPF